jgi:predicted nucleic acid-binding Zn ribbon protein
MALRMRQSLTHFEEEFRQDMEQERERSQLAVREVRVRSRKRGIERRRKRSSMRYWMLVLGLVATAVGITVAMFETLYLILG